MRSLLSLAAIATIAWTVPSASYAATVIFNIYGGLNNFGNPIHIEFIADQSPTPSEFDQYGFVLNVPLIQKNPETASVLFGRNSLFITNYSADLSFSRDIFTGPPSSPTFVTGKFDGWGWMEEYGSFRDPRSFTMFVSKVPEPTTWAMMLFGFSGIGLAMRRRKSAAPQLA